MKAVLAAKKVDLETQKQDMLEFCTYSISQVKQFMAIFYGSCVRFYSTVVEWDFLQIMKEDLIQRLTNMVFSDDQFSKIVLSLCREITKEQEQKFCKRLEQIGDFKPRDVGISPYLTLDTTSNLEQVFL